MKQYSNLSGTMEAREHFKNLANSPPPINKGKFFIIAYFALLAVSIFSASAQNIIIMKDGSEIEAKVIEVTSSRIKYEQIENRYYIDPIYDVPIKTMAKNKVLAIIPSFCYFSKNYIEQWYKKGEFEKTEDWQQRVSESNRQARETELLKEVEQAYITECSKYLPVDIITLGIYDADKEVFLIKNDIYGDWFEPVSINEAQNFKNNWNNFVKTPQYVIKNDRLALAGYNFEPVDITVVAEQNQNLLNASKNTSVSAKQYKVGIGLNFVRFGGGLLGFGGKLQYKATDRFRFDGSYTYYLNKDEIVVLGVVTKFSYWDFNLNGHYLFPVADIITVYPLVGLGSFVVKTNVDASEWGAGKESKSTFFFGFNLGGGIDLKLTNHFILNAEVQYKILDYDISGLFLSAGFTFKF